MSTQEVRCPACGTLNRVPDHSFRRIPRCGQCQAQLPETLAIRLLRNLYVARRAWPVIPVLAFLGWVLLQPITTTKVGELTAAISPKPTTIGRPSCALSYVPPHGVYQDYSVAEHTAKLTVKTAPGGDYLVSLADAATGAPIMLFFIYGGSTMDEDVPLGFFTIKYAAGKTWCGDAELFGPDTVFSQAQDTFRFTRSVEPTADGYVTTTSHWTIELILQHGGNLRTRTISRDEFYGHRATQ